ncbi:MAG: MarR family transcriptional regulator [Alphaproteobacteria bacterium]|nr:MarR family transcriptional regulator [Alphaproteobacteria bacterium]
MTDENASYAAVLRLFRAQSFLEARLGPPLASVHGLGLNELMLLMQLARAPLHRLRRVDLAAMLNASQSTVTRMALPLEKTGFVKRESDPRDARVAYVVLTKAGRAIVDQAEDTLRQMSTELFRDRWTDKEIAALGGLLGRFTAALPGEIP